MANEDKNTPLFLEINFSVWSYFRLGEVRIS